MSIYSGFPTRRDQEKYNQLLTKLIRTMQSHLLQVIGEVIPHAKIVNYSRIIAKMRDFEEHKYLPPKFSQLLNPLCKVLGISGSLEQKVNITENQNHFNSVDKIKMTTQSMNKYRGKSQYQVGYEQENQLKNKQDYMNELNKISNQGNLSKRTNIQSSFDLQQRKFNYNVIPSKDDKLKVNERYDDKSDIQRWASLAQTNSTKGTLVAKLKSNLKYKNFQPFKESQQNLKNKQKDTQQEIQKRRIKTTHSYQQ